MFKQRRRLLCALIGFSYFLGLMIKNIAFELRWKTPNSNRKRTFYASEVNFRLFSNASQRPTFPLQKYTKCVPSDAKLNKKKFRSQRNEDEDLDRYIFRGRTGGIFLEIGGLDGLKFSNSWYFEQTLCWRGILIEGLPSSYEKMKKNRPLAVNIGQAVCYETGVVSYTVGDNFATAGLESHMDDSFKDIWHKSSSKIDVCCNPMSKILHVTQVPYINLLSVDVEGAEELVLQTIDWENISIEVILVETDSRYMNGDKAEKIESFLMSKGFELFAVGIKYSTVFRNVSFNIKQIDVHAWSKYASYQVSNAFGSGCIRNRI